MPDMVHLVYVSILCLCTLLHLATIFLGDLAWWIDVWSHFQLQLGSFLIGLSLLGYIRFGSKRPYARVLACYGTVILVWVAWTIIDLSWQKTMPASDVYFQNVLYAQSARAQDALASNIARHPARVYAFVEPNPRFVATMQRMLGVAPILHHSQGGRSCAVFVTDPTLTVDTAEIRTDPDHDPLCVVHFSTFDLFVAHPLPPLDRERYRRQDAYIATLTDAFNTSEAAGRDWLMVGDLNMTPYSVRFRNAFGAYARTAHYTWRTISPLMLPIDHVFGTVPHHARTMPAHTSDHRGLAISFTGSEQSAHDLTPSLQTDSDTSRNK